MNIRIPREAAVRAGPAIANAARGSSLRTHSKKVATGLRAHATFLSDQISAIGALMVGLFVLMGVWFPVPEARLVFYLILRPTMSDPGRELSRVNRTVLKIMFGGTAWAALERDFLVFYPHYRPIVGPANQPGGATMTDCEMWLHGFTRAAVRAHPSVARAEAEDVRDLIEQFRMREYARSGTMMTMEETRTRIGGHLMQEDLNTVLPENEWGVFNGLVIK